MLRSYCLLLIAAVLPAFAGEYAVLTPGWPALVLAVDRGLHAELDPLEGDGECAVELWHRPSGVVLLGELCSPAGIAWLGEVPDELRFAAAAAARCVRRW